jgi:ribosomal protein L7Ae-like RNA K-turn-binding protein
MSDVLGLLGLGLRGGLVVLGVDAVRKELQSGTVRCVVLAADASPRAVEKVVRLAAGRRVPLVPGPDAAAMGERLGRPPLMVVGVRDRGLAEGILRTVPERDVMED